MYSRNTNIAPRRDSFFGSTSSFLRRSSLSSVAEDDRHQPATPPTAQEMQEMRVSVTNRSGHNNAVTGRRDSLASSVSSASTTRSRKSSKPKRRDSLASWASGRKRKSSSSKRRGSLESTASSSRASEKSSVVSMSEGDLDTLGWTSRRTFTRRGSFFRKRRLASEIDIPPEDGSMNLSDLSALTLSEVGAQEQKSSSSAVTASTARSQSDVTILSSDDGDGTADQSTLGQQRPPRPTDRAIARYTATRPVKARVDELFAHERSCFDAIKMQWQAHEAQLEEQRSASYSGSRRSKKSTGVWSNILGGDGSRIAHLTDEQYLHFARSASYDEGAALTLLRKSNRRMLGLTCAEMEPQLRTKTIFIIPGLQSREGFDVFYMRPSRYFPKQTKTSTVIDNLAYVMKVMLERERSSTDGIAFMANMAGWEMTNFSMNYCLQFMKCLQAEHFPVEVRKFLIIDPPSWFGQIWKIMKTMLTPSFQKRVRIIPNSQLGVYLSDGYRMYLPDDMVGGQNATEEMIHDFIEYRKHVEYVAEHGEEEEEEEDDKEGGSKGG